MKQHAIIEKTARFIASQGVQMEILLKAKQSNNMQFEFLSANSILNAYYKFMINAIKQGQYPAETVVPTPPPTPAIAAETTVAAVVEKPAIIVPSIKYIPSANCAYTQLISKIKGVPLPDILDESSNLSGLNSPIIAINSSNTTEATAATAVAVSSQNGDDNNSNSNSNSNSQSNELPSKVSNKVEILKNSSALALAQNYSDSESDSDNADSDANITVVNKTKSKAGTAANGGKPNTPPPPKFLSFPTPPEPLLNIIDKTAQYVIKNGRQFEETLRSKDVDRFSFLTHDNEYYPYYMFKISGDPDAASKEQKTRKDAAVAAALLSKKGLLPSKESSAVTNAEKIIGKYIDLQAKSISRLLQTSKCPWNFCINLSSNKISTPNIYKSQKHNKPPVGPNLIFISVFQYNCLEICDFQETTRDIVSALFNLEFN